MKSEIHLKTSIIQKIALIIASILMALLFLEGGLRLGGFIYLKHQEYNNRKNIRAAGTIKIMCVGESTTAIGGVFSYPSQMEDILNKDLKGKKIRVINKGVPMTNTSIIRRDIDGWLDEFKPNLVVIMMGINDHNGVIPVDLHSSQQSPFLHSLRIYKLYRWLVQNFKGQDHEIRAPQPKKLSWIETQQAVQQKRTIDKMIMAADAKGDPAAVGPIMQRIRKLSEWVSDNEDLYGAVGRLLLKYRWYKHLPEVIDYFADRNPHHGWLNDYIVRGCRDRLVAQVVIHHLQQRIQKEPRNQGLYQILGACYAVAGAHDAAEKTFDELKELQRQAADPITQANYVAVLRKLQGRKVPFILVQYPMRSVQALRSMLEDRMDIDRMIFVDNEKPFHDGVARDGYDAYFIDRFGGDFGHCTPKGDHLLASNVARVIMRLMGDEGGKNN